MTKKRKPPKAKGEQPAPDSHAETGDGTETGSSRAIDRSSDVRFDLGVVVCASFYFLAPDVHSVVAMVTPSAVVLACVIIGAVLPFSLMRQHAAVQVAAASERYRTTLSFAVRLFGMLLVIGTLWVMPANLSRWEIVPDYLDDVVFVVEILAIVGGVIMAYGNPGAGLVMVAGAATVGLLFSLPDDVQRAFSERGTWPVLGALGGLVMVGAIVMAMRSFGDLEELSQRFERWITHPWGVAIIRTVVPFVSAVAFSLWTLLYADLFVARLNPIWTIPALILLGVIPYRILLLLTPPLRLLPTLTGVIALLVSLLGQTLRIVF